jgi:hypothetical protein
MFPGRSLVAKVELAPGLHASVLKLSFWLGGFAGPSQRREEEGIPVKCHQGHQSEGPTHDPALLLWHEMDFEHLVLYSVAFAWSFQVPSQASKHGP